MKTQTAFLPDLEDRFAKPELWNKIKSIDLTLIKDRMLIKYKWSKQRTDDAIEDYLKYLYLTKVYGMPISPTVDADEIWHQHILFTNKYAIDCQKTFGHFMHHFPTPSRWKLEKAMAAGNCSSPCCNHQDCCNDNPALKKVSKISISPIGELLHADCDGDGPIEGGCVGIGGNETYCSGTTNDKVGARKINYDNPNIENMKEPVLFKEIVHLFFK